MISGIAIIPIQHQEAKHTQPAKMLQILSINLM